MHIIPVIDVRNGIAVRAVAGDRSNYQPLLSPLIDPERAFQAAKVTGQRPGDPVAVAKAYCNLFPFPTLYVADLDGIEGRSANSTLPPSIASGLPGVEVWLDAGASWRDTGANATAVVGSESLDERDVTAIPTSAVLSLDFRGGDFIGPPALLASPYLWPERIIVMTLARVGTGTGPDLDRIAEIARRAPQARVYAAGGIRDIADLRAARAAGAHGALIASALHSQKIKADDLREIIGL